MPTYLAIFPEGKEPTKANYPHLHEFIRMTKKPETPTFRLRGVLGFEHDDPKVESLYAAMGAFVKADDYFALFNVQGCALDRLRESDKERFKAFLAAHSV